MPAFWSSRQPAIDSEDLPEIIRLFETFQRITFDHKGDMIALLNFYMEDLGHIALSLHVRKRYVLVCLADTERFLWSGGLHALNDGRSQEELMEKDTLIGAIKLKIREAIDAG